jgi:serine/threonine-protein kinase
MARVYDAYDERLERPVAVKILHRATEALPGMRQRFGQEARIAARLIHPYIVAVLDYGEDHDACYLVMERLPGTTLRDELARGPVPMRRVVLVMMETLTALEAAHRYGVLHRDIKPSNILHQDDGHTKIADFGIAKSFDLHPLAAPSDDTTQTGIVLGTPGYLAPERRTGQPASVRSDLYSVGTVMVEALTGTRPEPDRVDVEGVPEPLRVVAARAAASDPNDRYASAEELLHELTGLQRDRPPVPLVLTSSAPPATRPMNITPTPPPPGDSPSHTMALPAPPLPLAVSPAQRRLRRRLAGLAIGGVVLAAVLGLTAALVSSGGAGPARGAAVAPPHRPVHTVSRPSDPTGAQLRWAAATIAAGTSPGDSLMARALDAVAAQPRGAARVPVAEQGIALAEVLLAGGGITSAEYQSATSALEATGASPPALPINPLPQTTTPPAPSAPPPHAHGHGDGGQGSQD